MQLGRDHKNCDEWSRPKRAKRVGRSDHEWKILHGPSRIQYFIWLRLVYIWEKCPRGAKILCNAARGRVQAKKLQGVA